MVVADRYYMDGNKPDNEVYKKLKQQFDADEMYLNTVDDTELELFIKEEIDLENL